MGCVVVESFELEGIANGHLIQPPATNSDTHSSICARSPVPADTQPLSGGGNAEFVITPACSCLWDRSWLLELELFLQSLI